MIEITDVNTRIAMLYTGEADAVRLITNPNIPALEANPNTSVPIESAIRINLLLLNHARAPFKDKRVREAAALGLDLELITKVVARGRARILIRCCPTN